ncbi:DUF3515 domain-containing protein [Nostocoides sp. F2B08]|uniref:DUF3515 domain-containing protein n=1 Tax=Nostocoides sp. F2B08 TaxID=2653936 RepID=UPI001D0408C0|nr:DUF3515 domain-containing protein [Tetrasphaera sp. F2B08]
MHRRPRLTPRRSRRPTPLASARAALLAAPLLVLTACSTAVEVAPPDLAADPACASVAWPQTVSGLERAATDPEGSWVAAWGDPAVIARCGLPALEPTTFDCVDVDGTDWVVRELSDGTAMSTYGTDPAIEVLVPSEYGPGPLLLPAFTAVAEQLPPNGRTCE